MELEYFDEPRKCGKCQIVTYCDRCPICGELLPRSAHSVGKKMQKLKTAGEEGISQPKNHEVHRGHIKTRTVEPKINLKSDSFEKEKRTQERPTPRRVRVSGQPTYTRKNKGYSKGLITGIIVFVSVLIGLRILLAVAFFVSGGTDNHYESSGTCEYVEDDWYENDDFSDFDIIDISMYKQNPDDAIYQDVDISNAWYERYGDQEDSITLYILNNSNRIHIVNMDVFKDDNEITAYEKLAIMPKQEIYVEFESEDIPNQYRLTDAGTYEIGSTAPNFDYATYQSIYGNGASIFEEVTQEDLEILVRFLYEANVRWNEINDESEYGYFEDMKFYLVNNEEIVVTINDQKAYLEYDGDEYDYQNTTVSLK